METEKNISKQSRLKSLMENSYIKVSAFILMALIAILAWIFPLSKEKRDLKIGLVANIQPIEIMDTIKKDDFAIFYKEKPIENLNYLKFRIQNTGNVPIIKENFINDVELIFPETIELINYELSPNSMLNVTIKEKKILAFNSDLLNPGDTADLILLCENKKQSIAVEDIQIRGKIFGITNLKIKESKIDELLSDEEQRNIAREKIKNFFKALPIFIIFMAFSVFLISLIDYKGKNRLLKFLSICFSILLIGFVISLIIYTLYKILSIIYQAF